MCSEERLLGNRRLGVFSDYFAENSFIVKTAERTFARINKVEGKWRVWYYTKHLQKDFDKLKEALYAVNQDFIKWWENREVYERDSEKRM